MTPEPAVSSGTRGMTNARAISSARQITQVIWSAALQALLSAQHTEPPEEDSRSPNNQDGRQDAGGCPRHELRSPAQHATDHPGQENERDGRDALKVATTETHSPYLVARWSPNSQVELRADQMIASAQRASNDRSSAPTNVIPPGRDANLRPAHRSTCPRRTTGWIVRRGYERSDPWQ